MILYPAGTAAIKFTPGHYCGKKWGFGISFENWMVKPAFEGADGFSAGGVLDFRDVEKLYKEMIRYKNSNKRRMNLV